MYLGTLYNKKMSIFIVIYFHIFHSHIHKNGGTNRSAVFVYIDLLC